MLRRLSILFLLLAVSGCTIPTEPSYVPFNNPSFTGYGYNDIYLLRSPIPGAFYDGLFSSEWHKDDYLDSTAIDSFFWYNSSATLYNKFGDLIQSPSDGFFVQVNGARLIANQYFQLDTPLNLNFPSPVAWTLNGDSYFPSFSHSISSENPPEILSPLASDSLNANASFNFSYNAPGVDSVVITLWYFGLGINATTDSLESAIDLLPQVQTVNSGAFIVPAYALHDTVNFKSFTPQSVQATVAWAHGDTIHVEEKVFGFVTEVACSRTYNFKQ
jgi:hypothetical protein